MGRKNGALHYFGAFKVLFIPPVVSFFCRTPFSSCLRWRASYPLNRERMLLFDDPLFPRRGAGATKSTRFETGMFLAWFIATIVSPFAVREFFVSIKNQLGAEYEHQKMFAGDSRRSAVTDSGR
ncbi:MULTISPECIES: hypothetical protein [unclassified Brenneria]|uniref:hypothetical protein n=1 Tax=unclassified Brenneria TaxID=2634434 RepID=UPI0018F0A482|nr:hypothetical protein [Brenneria sp. L3-3C-1]MBJ7223816.1 hypothetical protein [Brenneria sp. L3-3C-1]MEE3645061.1 hypothetical protein [Brenneria sp. L3_3C_1]